MKTYAYVTYKHCKRQEAVLPGALVGRTKTPVSRHGDYCPWIFGKRDTLYIIAERIGDHYFRNCARLVAELRGWA